MGGGRPVRPGAVRTEPVDAYEDDVRGGRLVREAGQFTVERLRDPEGGRGRGGFGDGRPLHAVQRVGSALGPGQPVPCHGPQKQGVDGDDEPAGGVDGGQREGVGAGGRDTYPQGGGPGGVQDGFGPRERQPDRAVGRAARRPGGVQHQRVENRVEQGRMDPEAGRVRVEFGGE